MENNATFINKQGKEVYRQPVATYTRVMGYLSPVWIVVPNIKWWMEVNDSNRDINLKNFRYNLGKRSEFYSRKYFSKEKAENHNYIDYGSSCGSLEFVWEHFKVVSDMVLNNREFIKQYI